MILPENRQDREKLYRNLARACAASKGQREGQNRQWRTAYLQGTTMGTRARYNKLKEHVQESAADLYAPESTRFSLSLPKRYGDMFLPEQEVAREDFHDLWSASKADLVFAQLVEWAHVYPMTLGKVILNRNRPALAFVEPTAIGVLHEELPSIGDQEALCHWYTMSLPAFERVVLEAVPNRTRALDIIRAAHEHGESVGSRVGDAMPQGMSLILSAATPTMTGSVPGLPDVTAPLEPLTYEPVVRLCELWVWDDEAVTTECGRCGNNHVVRDDPEQEDALYGHELVPVAMAGEWKVVTILMPTDDVLWEVGNSLLPGQHPFFPVQLEPIPGFLWGDSPLDDLLSLQMWHEDWLEKLRQLFDLNADPPRFAFGLMGLTDEKMKILRAPGGDIAMPQIQGDIKPMAPPMPPDGVDWLSEISRMLARMAGRPAPMSSQYDASSRTGEQDLVRAMLGAGPTLTKAMRVEAALAEIATAMWRLHRRVYPHPLYLHGGEDGQPPPRFYLSQIPADGVIKVAGHTQSPVFQTQLMPKLQLAAQANALDPLSLLTLLNLPMSDDLKAGARKMALTMQKRGEEIQQNKNLDTRAKVMSAQAKMIQAQMP